MGFSEFLGSIVKAFTPPGMSDSPSCAKCMNCKARIKELPSGKQRYTPEEVRQIYQNKG